MKKLLFITLVLAALLPVELWAQSTTGGDDGSDAVAAPTFRFDGDYLVIETATEDASIFYQMADLPDMSDETIEKVSSSITVTANIDQSNYYEQPIELKKSVVLKAIAAGATESEVSVLVYDYDSWHKLQEAIEYGEKIQSLAQDNANVDEDLKEQLKWILYESMHFYEERAMMPYQEAQHFTNHIFEICAQIEQQMGGQTTAEPYAVLSENNTILTFYFDDQKEAKGGLSAERSSWSDNAPNITSVVFDPSFANYTELSSTASWFNNFNRLLSLTGLEYLNTSKVTDMNNMFYYCTNLDSLDVSHFDTSNVTDMQKMFYGCQKLKALDLSNFNTSNVTDMNWMFAFCRGITELDLSNFITTNVTDMSYMFYECSNLSSLIIKEFDNNHLSDINRMFWNCTSLEELSLANFHTPNVKRMDEMFRKCTKLKVLDLSGFDFAVTLNMTQMFREDSELQTIYVGSEWNESLINSGAYMFTDCTSLVGGAGTVYDANHTDATYAHIDGGPSNPGYFTDKNAPIMIASPVITIDGNILTIATNTIGANIYYTLDGSKPTKESTSYVEPITLPQNCCVRAIATMEGLADSEESVLEVSGLTKNMVLPTPVISHEGNLFTITVPSISEDGIDVTGKVAVDPSSWGGTIADVSQELIPLSYFNDCAMNSIPEGFKLYADNMEERVPGEYYSSGSRMFKDFAEGGDFTSALYIRSNYLTYGFNDDEHKLTMEAGKTYTLTFNTARWMSTGEYLKVVILNADGAERYAQTVTCNPDVNGTKNAVKNASAYTIEFTPEATGDYELRFVVANNADGEDAGETWHELLLANVRFVCYNNTGNNTNNNTDNTTGNADGVDEEELESDTGNNTDNNTGTNVDGIYDPEPETDPLDCPSIWGNVVGNFTAENVYQTNVLFTYNDISLAGETVVTDDARETVMAIADEGNSEKTGELLQQNITDLENGYYTIELYAKSVYSSAQPMFADVTYLFANETKLFIPVEADKVIHEHNVYEIGVEVTNGTLRLGLGKDKTGANWHALQIKSLKRHTLNAAQPVEGASIYYTTDDSTPTVTSTQYESHFKISENCTIKAVAVADGYSISDVATYVVDWIEPIDATFDSNGVLTVGSGTTMTDALESVGGRAEVAKTITAIVWNNETELTDADLQGLDNPNMLIYVTNESLAPQNRNNIITYDFAKNIVLTDVTEGNGNFYCPQEFKAETITYSHEYNQTTEIGVARGWESIALPFAVQTIMHETKGVIAPFGNDASNKHFWLRQLTENGLARATVIEPNTAYLISMPNNDAYYADFNLNGLVTFSSVDVWVPKTQIHAVDYHTEKGMVVLLPNFQHRASDYTTYALNVGEQRGDYPEGSVFEREYRDIRPFEAYTIHQGGFAPRFLPISDLNGGGATGIEEVRSLRAEGRGDVWYDMSGRRLQQKPAGKGVYILNGRKVVIK
jgi:surface protein